MSATTSAAPEPVDPISRLPSELRLNIWEHVIDDWDLWPIMYDPDELRSFTRVSFRHRPPVDLLLIASLFYHEISQVIKDKCNGTFFVNNGLELSAWNRGGLLDLMLSQYGHLVRRFFDIYTLLEPQHDSFSSVQWAMMPNIETVVLDGSLRMWLFELDPQPALLDILSRNCDAQLWKSLREYGAYGMATDVYDLPSNVVAHFRLAVNVRLVWIQQFLELDLPGDLLLFEFTMSWKNVQRAAADKDFQVWPDHGKLKIKFAYTEWYQETWINATDKTEFKRAVLEPERCEEDQWPSQAELEAIQIPADDAYRATTVPRHHGVDFDAELNLNACSDSIIPD
ncbi:hypothetical protein LTR05_006955 [Lithohypha guttulata]|uniref:Uncharacterized protein n=1 Tax=Lithohypha guttulata TaxID=1690604 RepID=A0AAN7SX81_9EURO|nr:hypothetical protein LTR05_006955 [Lithohypha guttulata]